MEHEHESKAPPAVAQTNESQQPETGALDHRPLAPAVDSLHFRSFAPTGQDWTVNSSLEIVDRARSSTPNAPLGAGLLLREPQQRLTSEVREAPASRYTPLANSTVAEHLPTTADVQQPASSQGGVSAVTVPRAADGASGAAIEDMELRPQAQDGASAGTVLRTAVGASGAAISNVHQPTPSQTGTPGRTMADKLAESSEAVAALELRMRNLTRRKLELERRELEFEEQLILAESKRIGDGFISMIDDEGNAQQGNDSVVSQQRQPRSEKYLNIADGAVDTYPFRNSIGTTLMNVNQSQLLARKASCKELPYFSGKPEEWPIFIATYETSTAACGYSDEENTLRLQRALKGKALEAVQPCLLHASNLTSVIETLRMLYGRPEIIVHSLIHRIHQMPAPRIERLETLIDFGMAVRNMCATITASGLEEYKCNVALMHELVEKLPHALRLDWARHRMQSSSATLSEFGKWIETQVKAASLITLPSLEFRPVRKLDHKSRTHHMNIHNATGLVSEGSQICLLCEATCVDLSQCEQFNRLNVNDRWATIRRLNACRKCLKIHTYGCKGKKACGKNGCEYLHHELLHNPERHSKPNEYAVATASLNAHSEVTGDVFLKYIPVIVYGRDKAITTFAFFDSGSTGTFIEHSLIEELGLEGQPHPLCLKWTGNSERDETGSIRVSLLEISGVGQNSSVHIIPKVHTVESLSLPAQTLAVTQLTKQYAHLQGLPIHAYENARPRLLIGIDNHHLVRPTRYAEGGKYEPVAAKTSLGWIVYGPRNKNSNSVNIQAIHTIHICNCGADAEANLDAAVKNFFTLESLGIVKPLETLRSKDDERALGILNAESKFNGKHYESGLLWRFDDVKLPCSRDMAMRRYKCLQKRMSKDSVLAKAVIEKMRDYERQGYIRRLSPEELSMKGPRDWFLPIFPVFNANKPGKVRVVFDAAAKAQGVSLNTYLLNGPDLLAGLLSVLYKFREHRVAIVGVIKEMFFQVRMKPDDQRSQMILWNENDFTELQAAVIGARFAAAIIAQHRIAIERIFYWTDSRDVICWMRSDHRRFSQFVAFRVGELLETTSVHEWRWLSTKLNVADDGTKWQKVPTADPDSRWFRGPDFLWKPECEWPVPEQYPTETKEELRLHMMHHNTNTKPWIQLERFSSWNRLLRERLEQQDR
ncbi:uncharacterized protein LOC121600865 [Anopheles merus]|uniref:uncharacterized protein LOC121600865 n=1 Tax=Anopheles merus TaxID=30066 RepID=UPI001BE45F9C|nr:uncharacterized protein LOC121600865 [Anopheles merus]